MNEEQPESSGRILVVDDDDYIVDLLSTALRFVGFEVMTGHNGLDALAKAGSYLPDLIILDVMMPQIDGFEVCRRLRADGDDTPVIFLTARSGPEDVVSGFTKGGDDYVPKPFSLEELTARVRAVLRRGRPDSRDANVHSYAGLTLDEDAHRVERDGNPIELSPTEFKVLRYMLLNPERVLSKAQILDHVWQYDFDGDPSIIETYMSYLRKKIDTTEPKLLHTVRGVGYVLRVDG